MQRREPLYRKVNTLAHGVHHKKGPRARDARNAKSTRAEAADEIGRGAMVQGRRRGLDYTPLYRFLLSRVGHDWTEVHAEAVARLDRAEPIFWMVALRPEEGQRFFRAGENSYFSGLYVTADNRLALVDPALDIAQMVPDCTCCTHSLNGKPFPRRKGRFGATGGMPDDSAVPPG